MTNEFGLVGWRLHSIAKRIGEQIVSDIAEADEKSVLMMFIGPGIMNLFVSDDNLVKKIPVSFRFLFASFRSCGGIRTRRPVFYGTRMLRNDAWTDLSVTF